jgi:solute:Na+ symporter, SSS family
MHWMTLAATDAAAQATGSLSGHFTTIDWTVLVGYLVLVSILGVLLAGKQKGMEDFFRGGDRLPWYAVSASMIATTISAVTFVGVPAIAFAGNMTYLQLGIIAGLFSRVFVAWVLIPAYYQKRIYSPYDYMGNQLGPSARSVTTGLFTLGGLLAQSARVYLTALVLTLVMSNQLEWIEGMTGLSPLASAIIIIGIIAVLWTMLGGIATVVWTDAMLFLVFVAGGIAALWVILTALPDGFSQFMEVGTESAKFKIFNIDKIADFTTPYTLTAAGFAVVLGNIGAYGTDQLLAQRLFTCKGKGSAQVAILTSYAAEAVTALMLLVGVGLFVFYSAFPEKLAGEAAVLAATENDKIFPIFILQQMPVGVTGLVIAGIFAAAISSLTSILAALAQTSVSAVYIPFRAKTLGLSKGEEQAAIENSPEEGKRVLLVSRFLIVFWGVALCLAAFVVDEFKGATGVPILDLALGLASYIIGGLFAAFMLAWLPMRINGRGLVWSAPLGVLAVFALRFHEPWAMWFCGIIMALLLVAWIPGIFSASDATLQTKRLLKTGWLLAAIAIVMAILQWGYFHEYKKVVPEGVTVDSLALEEATGEVKAASSEAPIKVESDVEEPVYELVMEYPPIIDPETGKPKLDMDAEPVYLNHPITKEPLVDADGNKIENEKARPVLRYMTEGSPKKVPIAWPWYAPIGAAMAFIFGYLLAEPKRD